MERIVFMGTPEFAVASLAALVDDGCNVVGVITAPDREAGRGMKPRASAVKEYALSKGLRVLQPTNLKSEAFLQELRSLHATLQVVVAFRMLPEAVWKMPPKGTFNLHASLLPRYRGAAPINHAVINGDTETGVTTFFLRQQIDTGDIILQERTPIGTDETAGELHDRLMDMGARLVLKTVKLIEEGNAPSTPQSGTATEAPKIYRETGSIDWNQDVTTVHNLIRGLSPYPAAHTVLKGTDNEIGLKVFRSQIVTNADAPLSPGNIDTDGKTFIHIGCANGRLALTEVQLAGRRKMPVNEFLKGFNPSGMYV